LGDVAEWVREKRSDAVVHLQMKDCYIGVFLVIIMGRIFVDI